VARTFKIVSLSIGLAVFAVLAILGLAVWVFIPLLPAAILLIIALTMRRRGTKAAHEPSEAEAGENRDKAA
jgi:hypothetical protein